MADIETSNITATGNWDMTGGDFKVPAPAVDTDASTKKYVDDNAGGTPEGTAILSTGEGGATKYLREDGDGTCSWQTPAAGGDVTAAVNLTDETLVQGDGGAKGVKTTIVTAAQVAANTAKDTNVTTNLSLGAVTATTMIVASSDGTDATLIEADTASAGLLGADKWDEIVAATAHISANGTSHSYIDQDVTSGSGPAFTSATLTTPALGTPSAGVLTNCTALPAAQVSAGTFAGALESADHGTASTAQIINVCYGTGSAPTANTTTIGSLFIKYTA